jgi:hypothetical protein
MGEQNVAVGKSSRVDVASQGRPSCFITSTHLSSCQAYTSQPSSCPLAHLGLKPNMAERPGPLQVEETSGHNNPSPIPKTVYFFSVICS